MPGCSRFEPDTRFYLRAVMAMPAGHEVTNIEFYGDDGNSSLSPTLDEESEIKEGRQSVGFLVNCDDSLSQETRTELWLFRYDDILFQKFDIKANVKNEVTILATTSDEIGSIRLILSDNGECDAGSAIVPKSELVVLHQSKLCDTLCSFSYLFLLIHIPLGRLISIHRNPQNQVQSQVNLCGSRGTGGVLTTSFGAPTCLNIFDLEEDEEGASTAV